jgi:hypothetical protein
VVTLVLGVIAPTALADAKGKGPKGTRLVMVVDFEDGEFPGAFEARGAAVNRGYVCPTGTNEFVAFDPDVDDFDFMVTQMFTCDDGSGTFTIDLWVNLLPRDRTEFVWEITGGSGDYADLTGEGTGTGRPVKKDDFRDKYKGRVQD